MKRMMVTAALLAIVVAAPAQAHHRKMHHHHVAVSYPDSVTLDGKMYKVCKVGMQDDCVQPRQAGLGFGNMPTSTYRAHHDKR